VPFLRHSASGKLYGRTILFIAFPAKAVNMIAQLTRQL